MPEISYNLINSRFIKDYKWISQAEVVITVTGPTDPLSLQLMRDAVFPEVEPRMQRLNEMLGKITDQFDVYAKGKKRNGVVQTDSNAPKFVKDLLTRTQLLVKKTIEDFQPAVQKAITEFCEANEKDEEKLREFKENLSKNRAKATVNTTWGLFDVGLGVSEIVGGSAATLTGVGVVAGQIAFWKGCGDLVKGSYELWGKLTDWWSGAEGAAASLKKQLDKIQNTPKNKKISKSDLNQASKLLGELESYLLSAELTGKQLSRDLEKLLKEAADCPDDEEKKKLETEVEKLIDSVAKQGPVISKFRPYHREADKQIKAMLQTDLDDTKGIVEQAQELYKTTSPVVDVICGTITGEFAKSIAKSSFGWLIEKVTG